MRYEKGRKEETRQRIIDVAAKRFREDGIAAAGVAGLMADAGLTNGAFYAHFPSKEDLVREAILDAADNRKDRLTEVAKSGGGPEAVIRAYLNVRHRDNPGGGCPTAALVAEVARHPKATRDVFTARTVDIVAMIAAMLPARSPDRRRRDAMALYAMMIGTLQLARAVSDEDLSREILEGGVDVALAFIDQAKSAPLP